MFLTPKLVLQHTFIMVVPWKFLFLHPLKDSPPLNHKSPTYLICIMPSRRSQRKKRSTTASPPPQPHPNPIETGNEPSGAPDSTVKAILAPSKSGEAPKTPRATRRSTRVQRLVDASAQEDPRDDGEPPAAAAVAAATPGEHIAAPSMFGMNSTYLCF